MSVWQGFTIPTPLFIKILHRIFMFYPKFAIRNFRIKKISYLFSISAIATDFIYADVCFYEKALAFAYNPVKSKPV